MELLSETDEDARVGSTVSIGTAVFITASIGQPSGQLSELVAVRLQHSADPIAIANGLASFIWKYAVGQVRLSRNRLGRAER